jgi:tRNA threonylcarbamoyladenosine biosynthesis protein TsaB
MTAPPGEARVAAFEYTLVLEASTYQASVALVTRSRVIAEREVATGRAEQEHLMPAVAAVLDEAGIAVSALARVVCGAGPGSFTSLRIAAALGKGLASAPGGPGLASVPSLPLIVAAAAGRLADGVYLASIDALRGERHAALVTLERGAGVAVGVAGVGGGDRVRIVPVSAARRLSENAVSEWAREAGATMIGPGCSTEAWPAARGVLLLWDCVGDADLESWEPDYGRLAEAEVRRAAIAADRAGV